MARETVKDFFGNPIGVIETDDIQGTAKVMSHMGTLLGRADQTGTYDAMGRLIAQGYHPELLIKK